MPDNPDPKLRNATVQYNGITIDYARVTEFAQIPVYDPSDSDLMYFNAKMRIEGYIYRDTRGTRPEPPKDPGEPPTSPPPPSKPPQAKQPINPALAAGYIRTDLMMPRRPFLLTLYGVPFMFSDTATQVAKGPHPDNLILTELYEGCFHLVYDITVPFIECLRPGQGEDEEQVPKLREKFNPIGSLRWRSTQTLRTNGLVSVEYDGTLMLRIPMEKANPEKFRSLMTPPVPQKFIRESASYTVQEDGMAVKFSFQDVEQFQMPPLGAIKASGQYVQTYQKFGGIVTGAVNVRIEGDVKKKKSDLIELATSVCINTLRAHGLATTVGESQTWFKPLGFIGSVFKAIGTAPANGGTVINEPGNEVLIPGLKYMVQNTEVKDNIFENVVEVSMMGMVTRDNGIVGSLPGSLEAFDRVPLAVQNGNKIGIAPALYGNTPRLNILAQLFNDPCLNRDWKSPSPTDSQMPAGFSQNNTTQATSPPVTGTVRTISTTPVVTDTQLGLTTTPTTQFRDTDAFKGNWEEYFIELSYRTMTGRYAMASTAPSLADYQEANSSTPAVRQPTGSEVPYTLQTLPVRLHADLMTLEMAWTASKIGTPPRVPVRESENPLLFLLYAEDNYEGLDLSNDNSGISRGVSGFYIYGCKNPSRMPKDNPLYPWSARPNVATFPTYNPLPLPLNTNPATAPVGAPA